MATTMRSLLSVFSWLNSPRRRISVSKVFYSTYGRQTVQEVVQKLESLTGALRQFAPHTNGNRDALLSILPRVQSELPTRRMSDSYDEAVIPLGSDLALRDKYVNYVGGVRIGRLLEDIDVFAVWLCYKYVCNPKQTAELPSPFCIVTALVDRINLTAHRFKSDADIRLSGRVTYAGTSSMEATVVLEQLMMGEWQQMTSAELVLVARDPLNQGSAVINPMEITSPDEQQLYDQGKLNKTRRKLMAERSLFRSSPTQSELEIIHTLFMDTVDPVSMRQKTPPGSVQMSHAKLKNLLICHPENRNVYGKMFGGFLMRQGLELASANCHISSARGSRPRLIHVDDIWFRKPVEVGSLLYLLSRVVYTEDNYMQVCVSAEVVDPNVGSKDLTNVFHFTFSIKDHVQPVLPHTYHEMMLYLHGRRRFLHMMGRDDHSQ